MAVSVVPFIGLIGFLFQVCYPLLLTIQVASEMKSSPQRLIQWTLYWMMFSMWTLLEIHTFWWIAEYLPLYYELKFLVFLWLGHPKTQGAGWLWYRVISDLATRHSDKIREFYELHVPFVPNRLPLHQSATAPWEPKPVADQTVASS